MAVERHLRRVAEWLPASAADLSPATDVSDAVVLHLWNIVAHAYETLDMRRVYDAVKQGPADLLAVLALLSDRATGWGEADC